MIGVDGISMPLPPPPDDEAAPPQFPPTPDGMADVKGALSNVKWGGWKSTQSKDSGAEEIVRSENDADKGKSRLFPHIQQTDASEDDLEASRLPADEQEE
jgi:hypothetical protein